MAPAARGPTCKLTIQLVVGGGGEERGGGVGAEGVVGGGGDGWRVDYLCCSLPIIK